MGMKTPEGRGKEWWAGLSTDQRDAVTQPFFKKDASNLEIATELHISPGSVSNMRNRYNRQLERERVEPSLPALSIQQEEPAEPTPARRMSDYGELDEKSAMLYGLITGQYQPKGVDRPFMRQPREEQQRIRREILQHRS